MSEAMIGQDQTAGDAIAVTDGQTQDNGQGTAPDLKTRVMQDGDFAWEQIQKRDRHASTLANRVKELEPVEQLVKFAGGDTNRLFQLTDLGNRVTQVPGLLQVVQQAIQTGRVELPQQTATQNGQEDDEWIDPDAKKVRDQLTSNISDLEQRYAALSQIATGADVRSKMQRVEANIDKVLEQFGTVTEARDEAFKAIHDRVRSASIAAENGDTMQAKLIDQLSSDGGVEILDVLAMPVFKKYAPKLVAASSTSTSAGAPAAGSRSTDDRTVNPSRPGATPLPPRPKGGRTSDQYVLQVMQAIARQKGIAL